MSMNDDRFSTAKTFLSNFCSGVGDVKQTIDRLDGGWIVDSLSEDGLMETVQNLDIISAKGGRRLRDVSRPL